MECPICKNEETLIDCIRSEIYCSQCGLVLTASHNYVNGDKITLEYGFRTGFRPCTEQYDTEYHADWNYQSIKDYYNIDYNNTHLTTKELKKRWKR